MKKRYLTFALCCTATQVLWSQVSYLSQPDVAVFIPLLIRLRGWLPLSRC